MSSTHQQHGINGCVAGEGWLPDSGDDEIAGVTLGERMGELVGSEMMWGHGCEL